ncbi:MAG: AAA family ATPase [Thermodesulfobacteriota bacterium]|nr:AAA family ATPase [Thermodesulfobacteriota bacterium]
MYLTYWKLREFPFENVPNSRLFFYSGQHEEALARLLYATQHQKGAAMLTGEVGSGKTTVGRAFMDQLPDSEYYVVSIINPALNPTELIGTILLEMGSEVGSDSRGVLLRELYQRLLLNAEQGLKTVLLVDEAHVVESNATFEQLRMLLNMQAHNRYLLTLILMGQPLLRKKLAAVRPLEERISIKYHMDPFSLRDTVRYILFRLKRAGAANPLFTKQSVDLIYDYSRGIPLRINNICDRSLLIGFMKKAKIIDSKIASDAIEEFQ